VIFGVGLQELITAEGGYRHRAARDFQALTGGFGACSIAFALRLRLDAGGSADQQNAYFGNRDAGRLRVEFVRYLAKIWALSRHGHPAKLISRIRRAPWQTTPTMMVENGRLLSADQ
jgi:hypothetical protein